MIADVFEILTDDAPELHRSTSPVEFSPLVVEHLRHCVDKMYWTMLANNGIGLAANQVGLDYRMFVVHTDLMFPSRVIINPKIKKRHPAHVSMHEGCLSYPDKSVVLSRPQKITVMFKDLEQRKHKMVLKGMPARVFQHELDHLDGITMLDRLHDNSINRLKPLLVDDSPIQDLLENENNT